MLAAFFLLQVQSVPVARLQELLSRAVEEAEMLRQNAPKALAEETLEQRALRPPSRFRPRAGTAAPAASLPVLHSREIVSEYSVGAMKDAGSERLTEFRQVVSVDGRPIQTRASARHALSLGLQSAEDRIRKKMLEDFERHGLVGSVTDFGILLLQFTKRGIQDVKLTPAGAAMVGGEQALVLDYRHTSGEAGVMDFTKRKAVRHPLEGQLLIRLRDGVPLRVTCAIRRVENKHEYVDQGSVDYTMTSHGFLAPVSVVHRGYVDGHLMIENLFRYTPFKTFGADAEIKFTEIPDPPPAKP